MSEQAMQGYETTNEDGQPQTDLVTAAAPQSLEASLADAAGVSFVPSEELIAELKNNPPSAELKADLKELQTLALAAAGEAILEGLEEGSIEIVERPNYKFVGREDTNFIVHRRKSPDKHHVFDFVDAVGGSWYNKVEDIVTSEPAGVDLSHEVIMVLAEETVNFFPVIEATEGEVRHDQGDVKNLIRFRDFVSEVDSSAYSQAHSAAALLRAGIRSINIGDRLIQKAIQSKAKEINGTITIGYQIGGLEGVNKYRLVGDISRDLILAIAKLGGTTVSEVLKKPVVKEPKSNPINNNTEQNKPVNNGQQAARSDANPGNAQLMRRLIDMNEALVADSRRLQRQVDFLTEINKQQRADAKANRDLLNQVLDSNNLIMQAIGSLSRAVLEG